MAVANLCDQIVGVDKGDVNDKGSRQSGVAISQEFWDPFHANVNLSSFFGTKSKAPPNVLKGLL